MDKEEKEKLVKDLILANERSIKRLDSFPKKDLAAVYKVLREVADARANELKGVATPSEVKLLDKQRARIKNFNEIIDAIDRQIRYNVLFAAHDKGADLAETAVWWGMFLNEKISLETFLQKLEALIAEGKANIN